LVVASFRLKSLAIRVAVLVVSTAPPRATPRNGASGQRGDDGPRALDARERRGL
jgi:hypothetical protein